MRENFELELRSNGGMARIVRDSPLRGQADRSVARGDSMLTKAQSAATRPEQGREHAGH